MILSPIRLDRLPAAIGRPRYDRAAQKCGIVHIGIGAFHRAHQAVYTDDAMNEGDRDWGIIGVSLRSAEVRRQMAPQSGLYMVRDLDGARTDIRVIGAVRDVLVAPENPAAVLATLASADTHIITLTVTEKGYWRDRTGALDIDAPAVRADLDPAGAPQTLFGYIGRALQQRQRAGLPGVTLLSCDNLADNGGKLDALLRDFLDRTDRPTLAWFEQYCRCPSTMVDRIVPATTPADRMQIAALTGLRDEATVSTEPFRQWVIEDKFAGPRPRWDCGGAQFVGHVGGFEAAKLRMLNGAHSALAYLGLARGHVFVHEAIADPALAPLIEHLIRDEAAPSLPPTAGLDVDSYADALIARFSNSALGHRLSQIAMDGSQKIPQRWLETLAAQSAKGQDCPALLEAMAAWITFIRADVMTIGDPMAAQLVALWEQAGRAGIVDALVGPQGLFAQSWVASPEQRRIITQKLSRA